METVSQSGEMGQSGAWLMLGGSLQDYGHREGMVVIATVSCDHINESSQENRVNKSASLGGSIGRGLLCRTSQAQGEIRVNRV